MRCAGIEAMTSRYVPYATTPARLLAQLLSDLRGRGLDRHLGGGRNGGAFRGRRRSPRSAAQVEDGATGIAGNLDSAGDNASKVPLIGDTLAKPLRAASEAALDIAGAGAQPGHDGDVAGRGCWRSRSPRRRSWRSRCRGCCCGCGSSGASGRRSRWPGRRPGEQLLALRALANRPLAKLAEVSSDPVGAWRREDPGTIRGLAALELRSAGVARRTPARN